VLLDILCGGQFTLPDCFNERNQFIISINWNRHSLPGFCCVASGTYRGRNSPRRTTTY